MWEVKDGVLHTYEPDGGNHDFFKILSLTETKLVIQDMYHGRNTGTWHRLAKPKTKAPHDGEPRSAQEWMVLDFYDSFLSGSLWVNRKELSKILYQATSERNNEGRRSGSRDRMPDRSRQRFRRERGREVAPSETASEGLVRRFHGVIQQFQPAVHNHLRAQDGERAMAHFRHRHKRPLLSGRSAKVGQQK